MGSQRSDQVWEETIMRFSLIPLATIVSPLLGQLKFNGGVSSSSSSNGNSNGNSPSSNRPSSGSSSGVTDVDEKLFFGGDTPSLTGNQALDGGIVGLGLGALGAAVLGPTIQGALNGAQQSQGYSCGRRKRQANFGGSQTSGGGGGGGVQETDVDERFFLPTGQGCTCNTNGRKRRQAPGEGAWHKVLWWTLWWNSPLWQLLLQHPALQQQWLQQQLPEPRLQQPQLQQPRLQLPEPRLQQPEPGLQQPRLQQPEPMPVYYSKTFSDQNGLIHGACQMSDNTG